MFNTWDGNWWRLERASFDTLPSTMNSDRFFDDDIMSRYVISASLDRKVPPIYRYGAARFASEKKVPLRQSKIR